MGFSPYSYEISQFKILIAFSEQIAKYNVCLYFFDIQKFYGFLSVYHRTVVFALKTSDIMVLFRFVMNKDVGSFCLTFTVYG